MNLGYTEVWIQLETDTGRLRKTETERDLQEDRVTERDLQEGRGTERDLQEGRGTDGETQKDKGSETERDSKEDGERQRETQRRVCVCERDTQEDTQRRRGPSLSRSLSPPLAISLLCLPSPYTCAFLLFYFSTASPSFYPPFRSLPPSLSLSLTSF